MSLEQSIEKLTAAIEAATGVLVALGALPSGKPAATPAATPAAAPATEPAKRGPGRPAKTPAPAPAPAADDGGLGGDDDGGLGGGDDDGGLGGGEPTVTVEEAKAAVLAYRDKAIKVKGKDDGLSATRTLMKKYVPTLDDIKDENAAEVHAAFTKEIAKLK